MHSFFPQQSNGIHNCFSFISLQNVNFLYTVTSQKYIDVLLIIFQTNFCYYSWSRIYTSMTGSSASWGSIGEGIWNWQLKQIYYQIELDLATKLKGFVFCSLSRGYMHLTLGWMFNCLTRLEFIWELVWRNQTLNF